MMSAREGRKRDKRMCAHAERGFDEGKLKAMHRSK